MAQQLGERIGVERCFRDLTELLKETSPDVVHITTPPQSHFGLAKQCLDAGSHVYLEKPFTLTAADAESLIRFAEDRDLKITVGHNGQFTSEMLEMSSIARLVQIKNDDDKTWPIVIAANAACGLNVFCRRLWLPLHHHETEPEDIETDRDHVGRERHVDRVVVTPEHCLEPPLGLRNVVS